MKLAIMKEKSPLTMKRFIKFESFKNRNVLSDFVVALKLYQKFQLFAFVNKLLCKMRNCFV